jgi:hypothetical protein
MDFPLVIKHRLKLKGFGLEQRDRIWGERPAWPWRMDLLIIVFGAAPRFQSSLTCAHSPLGPSARPWCNAWV